MKLSTDQPSRRSACMVVQVCESTDTCSAKYIVRFSVLKLVARCNSYNKISIFDKFDFRKFDTYSTQIEYTSASRCRGSLFLGAPNVPVPIDGGESITSGITASRQDGSSLITSKGMVAVGRGSHSRVPDGEDKSPTHFLKHS